MPQNPVGGGSPEPPLLQPDTSAPTGMRGTALKKCKKKHKKNHDKKKFKKCKKKAKKKRVERAYKSHGHPFLLRS